VPVIGTKPCAARDTAAQTGLEITLITS
jgi:hypothetical protein